MSINGFVWDVTSSVPVRALRTYPAWYAWTCKKQSGTAKLPLDNSSSSFWQQEKAAGMTESMRLWQMLSNSSYHAVLARDCTIAGSLLKGCSAQAADAGVSQLSALTFIQQMLKQQPDRLGHACCLSATPWQWLFASQSAPTSQLSSVHAATQALLLQAPRLSRDFHLMLFYQVGHNDKLKPRTSLQPNNASSKCICCIVLLILGPSVLHTWLSTFNCKLVAYMLL